MDWFSQLYVSHNVNRTTCCCLSGTLSIYRMSSINAALVNCQSCFCMFKPTISPSPAFGALSTELHSTTHVCVLSYNGKKVYLLEVHCSYFLSQFKCQTNLPHHCLPLSPAIKLIKDNTITTTYLYHGPDN